jgi:glycerophosphoryl diester phosphodiesterase
MRRPAHRPLVIAHRGHWKEAPENTLAAVRAALEYPVEGVEIDVHCTADGVPVVLHDHKVDRTTDGHGPVAGLTLAQVKALRVRNRDGASAGGGPASSTEGGFASRLRQRRIRLRRRRRVAWATGEGGRFSDERVPTLEEVLAVTRGKRLLCVEVKPAGIERAILEVIRACRAEEWVWVWSFASSVVRAFRELAPAIPGACLNNGFATWPADRFLAEVVAIGARAVSLAWEDITPEVVAACHDLGLEVYTMPPDEPAAWDRARSAGVEAIVTDDAPRLLAHWGE